MLPDGLYEQIINTALESELSKSKKYKEIESLDKAEASKILSKYTAEVLEKGLNVIKESGKKDGLNAQVDFINRIISSLSEQTGNEFFKDQLISRDAKELLALFDKQNTPLSLTTKKVERPETSLAQSSLFTGALNEPQMFSELKKEIRSADRIDMLVSFIRWSGLRKIYPDLKDFVDRGGKLRIITTSYMGATELKALDFLSELKNTELKVNFNTKSTRLHAKAYMFYRNSGFTTAYIGSSNLSEAALTNGLEWNVKVTKKDLPETIEKIDATFESYWNSEDFLSFNKETREQFKEELKAFKQKDNSGIYTLEARPYPFQSTILDKLEAERKIRNNYKNLVVAATGTGKTIISAFDYKRFRKENPDSSCRLLFIAHRKEILTQSLNTFRQVLKDPNFGDLFTGNDRPEKIDHLFMTIQTFNSKNFTDSVSPDFYDYIVVDEFHHAAAPSYQKLLDYFKPKILLGLTATPERMDNKDIFKYFDNKIAAEIRLPEAINRQLLVPFEYYGVTDSVDLNTLKWSRGGYDKTELSDLYSIDKKIANRRADLIVNSLLYYVSDIEKVKGLGFCVSVEHAKFMADFFNNRGIQSIALSGDSPNEDRENAKLKIESGEVKFIFVVDLYNEGVDIPEINTILFLRPTESLTVFLQQLGRGLRLSENKENLTVLDFIGQAHCLYNFEDKFKALLTKNTVNLEKEIKNGFVSLPAGCYIQLERKASEYILENIRSSLTNKRTLLRKLSALSEERKDLALSDFLNFYNLDPRALYRYSTFSKLKTEAKVIPEYDEPLEDILRKAFLKLSQIDSRRWISFLLKLLPDLNNFDFESLSKTEKRLFQMFYLTIWNEKEWNKENIKKNIKALSESPVLLKELTELLKFQYEKIDFIDEPEDLGIGSPLDVYCTYSRDQILAGLDFMKPSTVREGVKWLKEKNTDLLFVTLNKSDKDYSPTTMYKDYSVNENLFHWQSQSGTSEKSKTGQRYINHEKEGSNVLLFVREFKKDPVSNQAANYTYLGPVKYTSHTGERPMNILWELKYPIPAKYLKTTNKLLAS